MSNRKSACYMVKGRFVCEAINGESCGYGDANNRTCQYRGIEKGVGHVCNCDHAMVEGAAEVMEQAEGWWFDKNGEWIWDRRKQG